MIQLATKVGPDSGTGSESDAAAGPGAGIYPGTGSGPEAAAGPGAYPWTDSEVDALEDLEDRIRELAAHLNAGGHRLLVLVLEFDRLRGWERAGHRSCAHWLAFHTGVDVGTAREQVRVARALPDLPLIGGAMARGELSFSAVQELTRVATAETEADLLEFARSATVSELKRLVRSWHRYGALEAAEVERVLHASRRFSVVPDGEGMYVVRGRLTPEVAAVLMRAVEAAGDALYRKDDGVEPPQRRADALGLVAERALAAGFGAGDGEGCCGGETPDAPADACCGGGSRVPLSGSRAERYQVVVHVDAATLGTESLEEAAPAQAGSVVPAGSSGAPSPADTASPGRAELEDGTRLTPETARRLACDASVVRVLRGGDGSVLDVGRRTRTISPALRRALEVRDRGCRFPGCGSRFCEAHHIVHWSAGGETSLSNCLLACRYHHRLLHEEGFSVRVVRGQYLFLAPDGTPLPDRPRPVEGVEDPVGALTRENRRRGVEPTYRTCTPRYRRSDDVPLEVLHRAMEAAARGGRVVQVTGSRREEGSAKREGWAPAASAAHQPPVQSASAAGTHRDAADGSVAM